MTTEDWTEDSRAAVLEEEHWQLQWGVRRSIRYHRRRERWLDTVNGWCTFLVAFFSAGAVASLLTGINPALLKVATLVAAVAAAVPLAFGVVRLARLHSELARAFVLLHRDITLAGEDLPEHELRKLQARRLEIESEEPPVYRVLDAMCHDELITALGLDPAERTEPRWWQRWCANFADLGVHRLRKVGSRVHA